MGIDRPWYLSGGLALALVGCGAADAGPPPALPPSPPPASAPERPNDPPGLPAQAFADADPEYAFRDPERRKKLASAFPRFEEIAEDEVKKLGLPGLAIGVVIDGELAYDKGFGVADLESGRKPDADTVYRIGSITKSFTAAAILSLRDEGVLSLDDPLAKWIPEAGGLVYPTRDAPPITLRQLLTHTSGLPRDSALLFQTERAPAEEEYLGLLAGLQLRNVPGRKFVYSNLGFGLLTIAAGHAARMPYRELVNRRVLSPLGMTSTGWERASAPAGRLATAYKKGPDGKPKATEHWLMGGFDGAGSLYSTVRDMARYVAFQLAAYPPRNAPESGPLRRSSVREGHESALWDSLSVRLVQAPREGESLVDVWARRYGYGWGVQQSCVHDEIVRHTGGTEGFSAHVAFLPEQGVGVIAFTNLFGADPHDVVNRMLAELHRTGGLSKRMARPSPAFEPVMKKLLDVQNRWDEATYKAMLTRGRRIPLAEEKVELEGYRSLHGACKGYSPLRVESPTRAVFKMDCERGSFEMVVSLGSDGLIDGFGGTSRDLPVPPELRKVGERVVGLIKKWDEGVYKKHLAHAASPRDEVVKAFDTQRSAHGACTVKGFVNVGVDKKLLLSCQRGGDLALVLAVDPKNADVVSSYRFDDMGPQGTCPVR